MHVGLTIAGLMTLVFAHALILLLRVGLVLIGASEYHNAESDAALRVIDLGSWRQRRNAFLWLHSFFNS